MAEEVLTSALYRHAPLLHMNIYTYTYTYTYIYTHTYSFLLNFISKAIFFKVLVVYNNIERVWYFGVINRGLGQKN